MLSWWNWWWSYLGSHEKLPVVPVAQPSSAAASKMLLVEVLDVELLVKLVAVDVMLVT